MTSPNTSIMASWKTRACGANDIMSHFSANVVKANVSGHDWVTSDQQIMSLIIKPSTAINTIHVRGKSVNCDNEESVLFP